MGGGVRSGEVRRESSRTSAASEVAARRGRKTWSRADVRAPVAGDRSYAIVIEETSVGNAGVNAATWRTTEHEAR